MEANFRESIVKPILGFSLGTYLEFLDFALYAALAPIFAVKFFPSEHQDVAILYAWGVFAVSFLVRPFAGFILGPLGDKLGVKKMLFFSMALMGIATAAIGVLPTFLHVGFLSPLMLIVLRIVQGFAVSIEYGALSTYLLSMNNVKKHFGFYSSFTSFAVLLGIISGGILVALVINNEATIDIPDWQWRLPFIICGLSVGVVGSYLRMSLKGIANKIKAPCQKPVLTLFKSQTPVLFLVILITGFVSISSYVLLGYLATYLQTVRHFYIKESLMICNLLGLVMLCAVPLGGWISDKIGRASLIRYFSFSMIFVSLVSMSLLAYGHGYAIGIGVLMLSINIGLLAGGIPALVTEVFYSNHRYTGVTIAYNTAVSWLGGTSPMVISYLMNKTSYELTPGVYMSFFACLSLMAAIALSKLANQKKSTTNLYGVA
ncbi:MAG: MFS transporter [Candidatus Berkiella sp.]